MRRARTPQVRRRAQQRPQNLREQVRVFVGVDVRNGDSRRLNFANLCGGFGGNFVGIDAAGDGARREGEHAIAKVCRQLVREGSCLRAKNRLAVDQHHMAADAQLRDGLCQSSRFCEGRTVGHQRRRSHDAARVSLDDGPVHARSEAKIICIDDQTPHAASLAGTKYLELAGLSGSNFRPFSIQSHIIPGRELPMSIRTFRLPIPLAAALLAVSTLPMLGQDAPPVPANVVPQGTIFLIQLSDQLDTRTVKAGDHFHARLAEPSGHSRAARRSSRERRSKGMSARSNPDFVRA